MFCLCLIFLKNGCEKILLASKYYGWIINFLFLYVIPTKNFLVVFLLKRTQFLRFNSSNTSSFFGSPHNARKTYIKDCNCCWSTKSSQSRASLCTFLFIRSKRISSLVFVGSGEASCCFDEKVHYFTYSLVILTRLLLLHLRIPISYSSLLVSFIYSFIILTWLFLIHLGVLISFTSLLLLFTSSFLISTLFFFYNYAFQYITFRYCLLHSIVVC